jgi:glycosyltransferase involved in cell wall biosynthesis
MDSPTLSIGLAVRNSGHLAARCIESVLSQDFTDFEFVVCDNASDDGSTQKLEEYARTDRRFRLTVNPVNIGSHYNMRRVLDLSRGNFFRWISHDDWLEPGYLTACVGALENHPEAIGVTTWFTIHATDGTTKYEEYAGEFPDSPDPVRRFERMLWFFHAGDTKYDPMYGTYRRDRLLNTSFPAPSERTDWLTSIDLALAGPILNLNKRLANRTRDYTPVVDQAAVWRRQDPARAAQLASSSSRFCRESYARTVLANLTEAQLFRCRMALSRFWLNEQILTLRPRLRDLRHKLFAR